MEAKIDSGSGDLQFSLRALMTAAVFVHTVLWQGLLHDTIISLMTHGSQYITTV